MLLYERVCKEYELKKNNTRKTDTVSDFLVSAYSQAEDAEGMYPAENPWQRCAQILCMGKFND